eukprot:353633-Chlamydomonas_euryale.AAC.4
MTELTKCPKELASAAHRCPDLAAHTKQPSTSPALRRQLPVALQRTAALRTTAQRHADHVCTHASLFTLPGSKRPTPGTASAASLCTHVVNGENAVAADQG